MGVVPFIKDVIPEKNINITTNWETIVTPYCNHYWNNSKEG
jgi:hypothetical protein